MKVLIYGTTIPHSVDCSIAFHGFEELEADITISQNWILSQGELEKFDACVGGLDASRWALFRMGITNFDLKCYPDKLRCFTQRQINLLELRDVITGKTRNKFVKPVRVKGFSSFIDTGKYSDELMGLDDNMQIFVSDVVEFVSEWRVYVNKKKIENICFYKGNPLVFPNVVEIEAMINAWSDSPCCYALDVGVLKGQWYPRTSVWSKHHGRFPSSFPTMKPYW